MLQLEGVAMSEVKKKSHSSIDVGWEGDSPVTFGCKGKLGMCGSFVNLCGVHR